MRQRPPEKCTCCFHLQGRRLEHLSTGSDFPLTESGRLDFEAVSWTTQAVEMLGKVLGQRAATSRRHESELTRACPPQLWLKPDMCQADVILGAGASALGRHQTVVIPRRAC